jgi:hypothetical protein
LVDKVKLKSGGIELSINPLGLVAVRLADSDKIPYRDEFFYRVYAPNFEAVV